MFLSIGHDGSERHLGVDPMKKVVGVVDIVARHVDKPLPLEKFSLHIPHVGRDDAFPAETVQGFLILGLPVVEGIAFKGQRLRAREGRRHENEFRVRRGILNPPHHGGCILGKLLRRAAARPVIHPEGQEDYVRLMDADQLLRMVQPLSLIHISKVPSVSGSV